MSKRAQTDQALDAFLGDEEKEPRPPRQRPAKQPARPATTAEDEPLRPLTVYIPDSQRVALEARARAEDRSLGYMVRAALAEFLAPGRS